MMNQEVAFFAIFGFIGIYYIGGNYNSVTGFPGWFLLGEVFFLLSMFLGISLHSGSRLFSKISTGVLFFLGIYNYFI
jgi:hypothetical protein